MIVAYSDFSLLGSFLFWPVILVVSQAQYLLHNPNPCGSDRMIWQSNCEVCICITCEHLLFFFPPHFPSAAISPATCAEAAAAAAV
mmetsp:Transcript_9190/g.14583  ORF Transcript_9190/g.14583 Transcript_9190/m.14583 type:complete len:86 (-) Transcript_9190:539-796(-)